jgi:hypothetical protein
MRPKPFELLNIDITAIDSEDTDFELFNLRSKQFKDAFQLLLYNPIFLQEKKPGEFKIIDGFLTHQVISQNKKNTIAAFVFNSNLSDLDLWIFRLSKRIEEKNFSLISIIKKLSVLIEDNPDLRQKNPDFRSVLEKLHIPTKLPVRKLFTDIINQEDQIAAITKPDFLNLKELVQLSKFKTETLIQLSKLLGALELKGNKLLSCLKMIEELQNGFGISVDNILKDHQIQQILVNGSENLKYKMIKQRLAELRFPRLNRMQQKWDQNLKALKLNQQISVTSDPYFEDDYLKIEMTVKSPEQLKVSLKQLNEKVSDKKLKNLFDLI